jgi:ABC-type polysaccharide/polyol phosphate export permease
MITQFTFKNSFNIIVQLVKSEFKLRYQNSYLGYLWTLFKPLMLFGVIYLVFSVFMKSSIPHYPEYLLLGIIIWNYFSEGTLMGMNSLITKRDLITKIYFPREILVIASTLSSSITFFLNLFIFLIFLLVSQNFPGLEALFFFWYALLLYIFITGITFILATLYIYFHDLQHIWEVLLQIFFWLTPIIYQTSIVPLTYHRYIFLNPMARFIEYSRDIFIHHHIPSLYLNLILLAMSMGIFVCGYLLFKSQERKIAEKL